MAYKKMTAMRYRRWAAFCMATVTLSMSLSIPANAALPQVQVDETMYVNLDYYGKETQVNVVKGCSTNGVTNYTDYGVYDKVVNMTDKTEALIGDGTVSWQLPEGSGRFYYQCTMPEGAAVLPWDFDVSYKLNGVEADAAELAGASGLVEIHIRAYPNKKAKAYFRNNMMLSVIVPVDMAKCYSVDAPGSQLQSVGNSTAALFAALPGEEGDYTVRIGTDSFESVGVIMMMVPGTVDAFNNIKDLKEAKDTWREDGSRMYDSMNQLLKTMESMKTDVTEVKGGLGSLNSARAQVNQNRKQIEALSTQALADLQSVTDQTAVLIPYLDTAQRAITDINDNVNSLSSTMADAQDELDKLYDRLSSLRSSLESTSGKIGEGITLQEQQALAEDIRRKTAEIQQILSALGPILSGGRSTYELTEEDLRELADSLESADAFRYDREEKSEKEPPEDVETKKDIAPETGDSDETQTDTAKSKAPDTDAGEVRDGSDVKVFGSAGSEENTVSILLSGPSGTPGTGGVNDEDFDVWSEEEIDDCADDTEEALQALMGTTYQASVGDLLQQIQEMIGSGEEVQQKAGLVIGKVNSLCSSIGSTGHQTAQTVSSLRGVTDELVNLLDDSRVLIDTVDGYVPSMLASIGVTEELMNRLTGAMGSTHSMLSLVNDTAIAAGDSLDAGTKNSLNGMMELLGKSLAMLDATTAVRVAGEGMKGTMDEQLDKFEEENNFLNMDPKAAMVSFTSGKNPSPHSLQIIVRSEEISKEDEAVQAADMEVEKAEAVNPFVRMWRVIVEIFESIVNIFKNR